MSSEHQIVDEWIEDYCKKLSGPSEVMPEVFCDCLKNYIRNLRPHLCELADNVAEEIRNSMRAINEE